MKFPKQNYFRSVKHLKNVANLPCQLCGSQHIVQAAHSNWAQWGGKCKAKKASDEYTAALCAVCHHEIDQGSKWSKEERQKAWTIAHINTVAALVDSGQWPEDVPVPQID